MVRKRVKRYRKLRIKFTDIHDYQECTKNLIDLCRCLGRVKIEKSEVGEILTTGSLELTLARGVNRKRVIEFLISRQPNTVHSITTIGLKWRSSMKLP